MASSNIMTRVVTYFMFSLMMEIHLANETVAEAFPINVTDEMLLVMNTISKQYTPRCLIVEVLLDRTSKPVNYTSKVNGITPFNNLQQTTQNKLLTDTYSGKHPLQTSESNPRIYIDLKDIHQTKYVIEYINTIAAKVTPTACVSYLLSKPPNSTLLSILADPFSRKRLKSYFLVHTQSSTEAEQFLLDQRLGKEENVAALVQEKSQNKSYWRVLIRQLLHPSGSPQVLTVNRWSRDTELTSTENIFPEQNANFYGQKLTGVNLQYMPYLAFRQTKGSLVVQLKPCIDLYLLEMIAQKLNFTYVIVMPEDMSWGRRQKNGHFNGIIGEVEHGRANFSLVVSRTEERARAVDFTMMYAINPLTFMTAKSLPGSPWRKVITPFRINVWLCVLVSVGGGSLLYHVIYHAQATLTSSRLLSSHAFMHVLASFLSQSLHSSLALQAGRIFLGFWFLYAFLITSYYKTSLTSTLAVPFKPPAINTLLQLYRSDFEYGLKPTTSQHQYFVSSDIDLYQKMIERMSFYQDQESLRRAAEGNYAFVSFKTFLSFNMAVHNSNPDRKFDLRIATEEFYPGGFAWAVPKGALYLNGFNEVMQRSLEAGLLGKWFNDLTTYYVRESRDQQGPKQLEETKVVPEATLQVFSLNHLQGPFFMLLLGYGLGILLLVIEIIQARL